MARQNMRRLLVIITLVAGFTSGLQAQKIKAKKSEWQVNKFYPMVSITTVIIPVKLSMLGEQLSHYEYINSSQVPVDFALSIQDTTGYLLSATLNLGANIPFYRAENWSVGTQLHAGIGKHKSLRAAAGLESLVFDFPQYLYFHHYKGKHHIKLLAGYKYTIAAFNYHLPLAGIEFNVHDRVAIRLHGSLNNYKYYRLHTDGKMEPAMIYKDFGVTVTSTL